MVKEIRATYFTILIHHEEDKTKQPNKLRQFPSSGKKKKNQNKLSKIATNDYTNLNHQNDQMVEE